MRRVFIGVSLHEKGLRLRRRIGHSQIRRKSCRRRQELYALPLQPKNPDVPGAAPGKMNLVVRSGAEGIVAGFEPLKPGERKPPRRFQKVVHVLRAPGRKFMFRILSARRRSQKSAQNSNEKQFMSKTLGMHDGNYIAVVPRVQRRSSVRVPKQSAQRNSPHL